MSTELGTTCGEDDFREELEMVGLDRERLLAEIARFRDELREQARAEIFWEERDKLGGFADRLDRIINGESTVYVTFHPQTGAR